MSRILKSFVLALTVATGVAVPTIQTAQAAHDTIYTVYVWDSVRGEWVSVCRTYSHNHAHDTAHYYADRGYRTLIR